MREPIAYSPNALPPRPRSALSPLSQESPPRSPSRLPLAGNHWLTLKLLSAGSDWLTQKLSHVKSCRLMGLVPACGNHACCSTCSISSAKCPSSVSCDVSDLTSLSASSSTPAAAASSPPPLPRASTVYHTATQRCITVTTAQHTRIAARRTVAFSGFSISSILGAPAPVPVVGIRGAALAALSSGAALGFAFGWWAWRLPHEPSTLPVNRTSTSATTTSLDHTGATLQPFAKVLQICEAIAGGVAEPERRTDGDKQTAPVQLDR